jgi:hypothetical protein
MQKWRLGRLINIGAHKYIHPLNNNSQLVLFPGEVISNYDYF